MLRHTPRNLPGGRFVAQSTTTKWFASSLLGCSGFNCYFEHWPAAQCNKWVLSVLLVKLITLPAQLKINFAPVSHGGYLWSLNLSDQHQACVPGAICSERELERGDREVWGSVGDNQIGIIHSAAMPVKYGYDTVLDNDADNEQVGTYNSRTLVL